MSGRRWCIACGESLLDAPSYVVRCKPCFVEMKKAESAALVDEVMQLRAEVARLREQRQVIEPDMVKKLIQLCHPDRHSNSKTAHVVTQWLLSFRRETANV